MKQGAERAYVNGIVAPTTQYATGYAKMENINGTMQLPLRYIAEVNGFTVDYDADTEKTKVTNPADGTYLLITPGSNAVTKYAADRTLIGSSNAPLAFTIQNGVTMGPLRFTCEALGLAVSYQETSLWYLCGNIAGSADKRECACRNRRSLSKRALISTYCGKRLFHTASLFY